MSFDSSRFTFDARKNFLGVVMEQGRVQLDSDWNEWQAEFARRIQAGTLDTVGQSAYPIDITPNAFQITASTGENGNDITIGAGRYYVDGLLAENHGPAADAVWDPALGEMSGAPLVQPFSDVTTDYTQQPWYPNPPAITGNGPYLAYLDVWQREVTYLEDPYLIDKAVGVDTTGRLQTVWQVKLLDISSMGGTPDCSTDIPAFDALIQPSAGRLTNGVVQNTPSGPCCLSSTTGFTGLENQLYRVEIHQGGANPTFKWSRDNASVATSVTAIAPYTTAGGVTVSQLTVASLGRDQVLGFSNGDWIEITDDYQELAGLSGELHQITATSAPGLTITLDSQIALSLDPSNPRRHTRIVRWDQKGTANGQIPVPLDGSAVTLESGITVSFSLNPSTGSFYTGDFWNFAARTADGSIQPLSGAPPRGIHHHYAKLAIVTFPSGMTDCRVPWPPSSATCGCTIDIGPDDVTANNTLQNIVDKYKNLQTLTTICLSPGTYSLTAPLRLTSAHMNIALKACQTGTAILQAQAGQESQFADGMIVLDNANAIMLEGLTFTVPLSTYTAATFGGLSVSSLTSLEPDVAAGLKNLAIAIGVRPVNATNVTIEDCIFDLTALGGTLPTGTSYPFGAGIFACGQCTGMQVQNNQFEGGVNAQISSFQAGFLHAPAVLLNPPPAATGPSWIFTHIPIDETGIADLPATAGVSFSGKAAASVKTARAAAAANLKSRLAATANPVTGVTVAPKPTEGVTTIGIKNPVSVAPPIVVQNAPPPSGLAANGGSVLPAVLNDAFLKENTFLGLTFAVIAVAEPEFVDLSSNQVMNCAAGFWLLSPLQLDYLFLLAIENIGLLAAMAYPLPQNDTSTLVTIPAAPASVRIYAGASTYTDNNNYTWTPDATASAAFTITGTSTLFQGNPTAGPPTITDIGGGTDANQPLYQSERYGTSFGYTFNNLPVGYYQLTMKFAELTWPNTNDRIFNVSINNVQVLTSFDLVKTTGGDNIAVDQVIPNILPNAQGQIVVQFTAVTDNAAIGAIELDAQWSLADLPNSNNASGVEVLDFFSQIEQLAQQGYASLTYSPPQLRIQNNEMESLPSPCVMIWGDDSLMNGNLASLMMTGNRLSSTMYSETATFYLVILLLAGSLKLSPAVLAELLDLVIFYCTVTIVQVSQCVISANMFLNTSTDVGLCFIAYDTPVATPELVTAGNLLKGGAGIFPAAASQALVSSVAGTPPATYQAFAAQTSTVAIAQLLNLVVA